MRALASTTSSLQARNSSAELLTLTSAWEIGGTKCGKATHNEKSDSLRILYRQQTFYFCEKKSSFMYWSKERRRRIRRTTLLKTREFLFLGQKYQSKNYDEGRQNFSQKMIFCCSHRLGRPFCSLLSPCISITESIDVPQGSQARRAITKYENYLVRRKKKISKLKKLWTVQR